MAEIFRKSALEKLSSPEQLDKMIVITSPSFWLSMVGAGIIIVSALVWSIFGRLPENVDAQGIYVNRNGMQSVYAENNGVVDQILVADGDYVSKGDVIAVFDTEEIDKKIAEYEEKKTAVEEVSIETVEQIKNISTNDEVLSLYSDLYQNLNMLKHQTEQLEKKRVELAASEKKYLALEAEYYNSMSVGDSTDEQMEFQEAQSEYSTISNYVSNAEAQYDSAKRNYDRAKDQFKEVEKQYLAVKSLADSVENKKAILIPLLSQNGLTLENIGAANLSGAPADLQAAAKDYLIAVDAASNLEAATKAYQNALSTYKQAEVQYDDAEDTLDGYKAEKKVASKDYEAAKADYIHKVESIGAAQAHQSEVGNKYNVAANLYNSDRNTVQSLEDNIAQAKIQISVTKTYILSSLKNEYKQYLDQKEASEIKATFDGKISDLAISEGDLVGQGNEVAKIQKGKEVDNIVVCYVPVGDGRKVQEGMKVLIYPSTVNRQEYGHMEATVLSVDEYITSTTDMQKQLGNQNLVEAFMQNGPVVEVVCELRESTDTVSGYYWSSNKGASVMIEGGTMIEASVVVSEKPPISLLIPFLKEKLTIKAEE